MNLYRNLIDHSSLSGLDKRNLREAAGGCEVCGSADNLQLDHGPAGSTEAGFVRGALCGFDNNLVKVAEHGYITSREDAERVAEYLETTTEELIVREPDGVLGSSAQYWSAKEMAANQRRMYEESVSAVWHLVSQSKDPRTTEIAQLVGEQHKFDSLWGDLTSRDRIGRDWAVSLESALMGFHARREPTTLWQSYSLEQRAIQTALDQYINRLDGDELVVVREFMSGRSVREIAQHLPWSKATTHRRQQSAFKRLREWLEADTSWPYR